MFQINFSWRANRDLDRMYYDIALKGFPENAARFVDAVYEECLTLKIGTHRGTRRPQLGHGIRTIGFHRQVTIVFRVSESQQTVTIVRILRRGTSLEKAFKRT